ncbi:hypothetical protein R3I93_014325 [Phoxinus phoxinus]|uniref:UPAR/Ly6 domain-containing protein n=1 Tax=Phoxinus phoxinus TaxID=58324 RepID=A0AAN9CMB5_9TELE
MDLQLSVFLLFILFTAGHSLSCYVCSNPTGSCVGQQTVTTCTDASPQCTSSIIGAQVEGISSTGNTKACAAACLSQSFNFGIVRTTVSCCNTDLCNLADVPEPVATGKSCYYCDGQSCSNTVKCAGIEDRCINGTASASGQSTVAKGCVSKSLCDATTSVSVGFGNATCCEGNLCNGAQSVTQTTQSVTQTTLSSSDSTMRHGAEYIACILSVLYVLVLR